MNPLDAISIAFVILAVSDWIWTAVLLVASNEMPEPALRERAAAGVILSTIATIAAVLGLARLDVIHVPTDTAIVLLAGAFILVSLPQWIWGVGLLMGKFR